MKLKAAFNLNAIRLNQPTGASCIEIDIKPKKLIYDLRCLSTQQNHDLSTFIKQVKALPLYASIQSDLLLTRWFKSINSNCYYCEDDVDQRYGKKFIIWRMVSKRFAIDFYNRATSDYYSGDIEDGQYMFILDIVAQSGRPINLIRKALSAARLQGTVDGCLYIRSSKAKVNLISVAEQRRLHYRKSI